MFVSYTKSVVFVCKYFCLEWPHAHETDLLPTPRPHARCGKSNDAYCSLNKIHMSMTLREQTNIKPSVSTAMLSFCKPVSLKFEGICFLLLQLQYHIRKTLHAKCFRHRKTRPLKIRCFFREKRKGNCRHGHDLDFLKQSFIFFPT